MIHRKPTLGRGLADLLGARAAPHVAAAPAPAGEQLAKLPLDVLQRGRYQPRVDMRNETLAELADRSEEHTSELQSHHDLVCRLLLEKKNKPHETARPEACSPAPRFS